MLSAPLSLAYAPDIYAVAPPHRDARNLTAANAFRAGAACTPNADHGCLDGTPYDYDTQFVCGSHTILNSAEYLRIVYCCTGSGQHGTHSYNDGKCDLSPPDQCACYDDAKTKSDSNDAAKAAITAAAAAAAPKPAVPQVAVVGTEGRQLSEDCLIDVSSPPEGGYQCTGPTAGNDGMGCFNGWPYNYTTHFPAGTWLLCFGQYGVCPSSQGYLPYPLGSSYCCKIEGASPGDDYKIETSPCKCHRYGC